MKVTENTLIKMTDKEYFSEGAYVSSSTLKTLYNSSPAHLQVPHKDTDAMRFGRAMHSYFLDEPEEFENKFYSEPTEIDGDPLNRRLKAHREALKLIKAANAGDIIQLEEVEDLKQMQSSVYSGNLVHQYLEGGFAEYAIFSEINGVKVKIKMDYFIPIAGLGGTNIITDLKGCQDASERGFKREIYSRNYDLQAYMYREVCMKAYKKDTMFVFLAIEKTPPFAHAWYGASDEMLMSGKKKFEESLDIYRNTVLQGSYPQYQASRTLTFL